jgi:hypothetical protein
MPDASGTPTSPDNIPTYNTAIDPPSGKGFNTAMAAIQVALSARPNAPAGIQTNEAMIWNGTTFVRSSVTGLAPSGILGYPNDASKGLAGDGTWPGSLHLIYDSVVAGVSLPAASITTPTLPTTFKHLMVTVQGTSSAASTDSLGMRINGDAAAHYNYNGLVATGTTVTATAAANQTSGAVAQLGQTAGFGGSSTIFIPRYSETLPFKSWNGSGFGVSSTPTIQQAVWTGFWQTASTAITSLTFLALGGNIASGRISVYGVG